MSAAIGPFELPRCALAVGSELPCLARFDVLAGLVEACPRCEPALAHMRRRGGWARQMTTAFYLSDTIPAVDRAELVKAIRAAVKAKVANKAKRPTAQRVRLHELQRLVLSAQSSLSVDDYGEALVAAQRIIEEIIANAEQQPTNSGNGGMGETPAPAKSPGGELGGSLPGASVAKSIDCQTIWDHGQRVFDRIDALPAPIRVRHDVNLVVRAMVELMKLLLPEGYKPAV